MQRRPNQACTRCAARSMSSTATRQCLACTLSLRPQGRFWVPDPFVANGLGDANGARGTSLVTCDAAGGLNATSARFQSFEQQFSFFYYPFDQHDVKLDLSVPGAHLDCSAVADELNGLPTAQLLPASSPWSLASRIRAAHPATGGGAALAVSRCLIEVPVKRNYVVFVVQRLIPLLFIGGGALLVLFVNPTAAPAPGARMGILLSTMVLISLKSNADLGLGTLTYLIWLDLLKMVQFGILLVAVAETAAVHHLAGKGNVPKALALDRVWRAGAHGSLSVHRLLDCKLYTLGGRGPCFKLDRVRHRRSIRS